MAKERKKRTNMRTYEFGRFRRVYEDKEGRLFYRHDGFWKGTFREYCEEEDHRPAWTLKDR